MPPAQPASRRSLESVNVYVLIATIIAALFIIIPNSAIPLATTKAFLLAAGALITLAVYILARLSRGNIILPPLVLVGALSLPALAYLLSTAFSGVSFANAVWGTSLETDTLGFILVATVLGTLSALVLRRSDQYRSFLRILAWGLGLIALVQLIILAVGRFSTAISPAFSIVGSFSDLASVLGLGIIAILISFRFLDLSDRSGRLLLVSGVAALFLLAIANVSAVWILVALASLGLFVEAIMQRSPKASDADLDGVESLDEAPLEDGEANRSFLLPLLTLVISLFFLIGGTLGGALADALQVNVLSVSPSWQSTFSIARSVYAEKPVFGSGPNTFGADWLAHRDASLNTTVFWNVDFPSGIGFIPTSFVTTGVIGLVAWVAFLGILIVFGLRLLILRAPQDPFVRYVAMLSFVATLYLFSLAVFGLPNAVVLALAFIFAGLFVSTTRFAAEGRQWGIIFSRSPRIGFVIVFSLTVLLLGSVAAAYALIGRAIAAVELGSAGAAYSAGNLDEAERAIKSSISFAPSASAYQLESSIQSARLNQIAASSTMPAADARSAFQSALSSGINAALTATSFASGDYRNWIALGNLYAQAVPLGVSGAYENAKAAYEKAKALNPTNPQILYILAELDIAHKDLKAAESDLQAAIALKQDYTSAIFLLSQLEVQDGNVKDALDSALAAAYFTPNNPDILFQVGILYAATNDLPNAAAALSAAVSANPQFANARYFLSAVYAKEGNMKDALAQMQAIADLSEDNAKAVASQLAALENGTNPFPANLLSVSSAPVK